MNLKAAIMKIIRFRSKKGKATTTGQIYYALKKEMYGPLLDHQIEEDQNGRPAYQHIVRSYLSNWVKEGLLERPKRGSYVMKNIETKTTPKGGAQQSQAASDISVSEGQRIKEAEYLRQRRNKGIVERRKRLDNYRCQVCRFKFSFNNKYIIECHHTIPLADTINETITTLEDLVCLCPNCHRIAHIGNPPYSVRKLKRLIQQLL